METKIFLIKLKTYLSSSFIILFILNFFLVGCYSSNRYPFKNSYIYSKKSQNKESLSKKSRSSSLKDFRKPRLVPWQVWTSDSFGNEGLEQGERALKDRDYNLAIFLYKEVESSPYSTLLAKKEAFLRRIGTELRIGKSKPVLEEVSKYVEGVGGGISQLDPRISLVVSFAYYNEGDMEQALAWLSLSNRVSRGRGLVGLRAKKTASIIVSSIPNRDFNKFLLTWETDSFINSLLKIEKLRREAGEPPKKGISKKWFNEDSLFSIREIDDDFALELLPANNEGYELKEGFVPSQAITVGVLLPLSGQYEKYAEEVKKGVELAFSEFSQEGSGISLVFRDTEGSKDKASLEYSKLVVEEGANIVIGPMLVGSTEGVIEASKIKGVPFITFTKKSVIPELGYEVFRLGSTAYNQVYDLLRYTYDYSGINTYTIIYPDTTSGREFALSFSEEAKNKGGLITSIIDYRDSKDKDFLKRVIEELREKPSQAIFMPDSLENVWNVREEIRRQIAADKKARDEAREAQSYEYDTDYIKTLNMPIFLGNVLWDDKLSIKGYGAALNGSIYVTPFFLNSKEPLVRDFVSKYKNTYNQMPTFLSAQAFDATRLALQSVISTDTRPSSVINSINNIKDLKGVTGSLTVTNSGEIERRMSIITLVDGNEVEVMSFGNLVENSKRKD